MTSNELRAMADEYRAMVGLVSKEHTAEAMKLAMNLSQQERIAAQAVSSVRDCMARRYRQWANHLEASANEMDEA